MTQSARLHRHAQTPITADGFKAVGIAFHHAATACFGTPTRALVTFYSDAPVYQDMQMPQNVQAMIDQHNQQRIQHQGALSDITSERLAACRVATIDVRPEHGPTQARARLELKSNHRELAVFMEADQVLPIALGPVAQAWDQRTQTRGQRALSRVREFLQGMLP